MDTSNSSGRTMTMNMADFVRGKAKNPLPMFSPEEWLDIAQDIVQCYAPYLPHLNGVTNIKHCVNLTAGILGIHNLYHPVETTDVIIFEGISRDDINEKNQLFPIGPVHSWYHHENVPPPEKAWLGSRLAELYLFLTTSKEWVVVTRALQRESKGSLTTIHVIDLVVQLISEQQLMKLLSNNCRFWLKIESSLVKICEEGITLRQHYIDKLRGAIARSQSITNRFVYLLNHIDETLQ